MLSISSIPRANSRVKPPVLFLPATYSGVGLVDEWEPFREWIVSVVYRGRHLLHKGRRGSPLLSRSPGRYPPEAPKLVQQLVDAKVLVRVAGPREGAATRFTLAEPHFDAPHWVVPVKDVRLRRKLEAHRERADRLSAHFKGLARTVRPADGRGRTRRRLRTIGLAGRGRPIHDCRQDGRSSSYSVDGSSPRPSSSRPGRRRTVSPGRYESCPAPSLGGVLGGTRCRNRGCIGEEEEGEERPYMLAESSQQTRAGYLPGTLLPGRTVRFAGRTGRGGPEPGKEGTTVGALR